MSEQRRKAQTSAQSEGARETHPSHALEEKGKKIGEDLDNFRAHAFNEAAQ